VPLEAGQLAPFGIAAGTALVAGVLGTLGVRTLALCLGVVNNPNPLIPQHTRPVAYLGGVGVAIGIAAGVVALWFTNAAMPGVEILLVATMFLALGVADDLLAFKPAPKFALQAVIAALAVALGIKAELTGAAMLDAAISWFWITTLVNAFNFTDVCDGLLGSLSVVMFSALAFLAPSDAGLSFIVAAACIGFLAFNRPPASIFLGDAGSHLLGFLAAAITLTLVGRATAPWSFALAAAVLVVAVPLFELAFLTAVRVKKGLAWWKGSPDHFSLRLQAAGFTRARTDLIACAFAAAWAGAGVFLLGASPVSAIVAVGGVTISVGVAWAYLLGHEVKRAAPVQALALPSSSSLPSGVPTTP